MITKISIRIPSRLLIFILFILLGALFLYKNVALRSSIVGGDFIAYWLPNYYWLISNLKEGYIPTWQPYATQGIPYIYQPALSLFNPTILATVIFNLLANANLTFSFLAKTLLLHQLFYFGIGIYGVILLAKKLGLSIQATILTVCVYCFSVFNMSAFADLVVYPGRMLLPFLYYFIIRLIDNRVNFKNYLAVIFLNYLIFSQGYPYHYVYFLISQILLVLFYGGRKSIMVFVSAVTIALLLSMFYLLPQLDIYTQSFRFNNANNDTFHTASTFPPSSVPLIFSPFFADAITDINDAKGMIVFNWFSVGIFPLFFLILFFKNGINYQSPAIVKWLLASFIIGYIFSFGGYLNIPQYLEPFIVFGKLRSHWQFLSVSMLSASIMAGMGLDILWKNKDVDTKAITKFYLLSAVILFGIVILSKVFLPVGDFDKKYIYFQTFARVGLYCLLTIFLVNLIRNTKSYFFLFIAIFITILEFNILFTKIGWLKMPGNYNDIFVHTKLLPSEAYNDEPLSRVFFMQTQYSYNTSNQKVFNSGGYETTPANLNMPPGMNLYDWLRFLNTRYFVTSKELPDSLSHNLTFVKKIDSGGLTDELVLGSKPDSAYFSTDYKETYYIYEIINYLPRFYIPNNVENCYLTSCINYQKPLEETLVEGLDIEFNNQTVNKTSIKVISYEPNQVILSVNALDDVFIASSEVWNSGWSLSINNEPSTLYKANSSFRGFVAPKGESEIVMKYRPRFIYEGLIVSLGGIIILLLIWKKNLLRKIENIKYPSFQLTE